LPAFQILRAIGMFTMAHPTFAGGGFPLLRRRRALLFGYQKQILGLRTGMISAKRSRGWILQQRK